jgi:hypothetical protein
MGHGLRRRFRGWAKVKCRLLALGGPYYLPILASADAEPEIAHLER